MRLNSIPRGPGRRRGFTLVEMIGVLAVISILVSAAVRNVQEIFMIK